MEKDVNNIRTSDTTGNFASDSESGTSATGNGIDGSGGNANGSGGNANGSDRGIDGSDGSDSSTNSLNGNGRVIANDGYIDGNQNTFNSESTSASNRGFGDAVRDRVTGDFADGRNATGETGQLPNEFTIGLGKGQRGRPRKSVNKEANNRSISARETKELISVFIGTLFEIPAITLKADFWRLSDAENETITNAISTWIDSLPKSKSNKFTKWLAENMPIVNLALVGFFILGERTKQTIDLLKSRKISNDPVISQQSPQKNGGVTIPLDVQNSGMVF